MTAPMLWLLSSLSLLLSSCSSMSLYATILPSHAASLALGSACSSRWTSAIEKETPDIMRNKAHFREGVLGRLELPCSPDSTHRVVTPRPTARMTHLDDSHELSLSDVVLADSQDNTRGDGDNGDDTACDRAIEPCCEKSTTCTVRVVALL